MKLYIEFAQYDKNSVKTLIDPDSIDSVLVKDMLDNTIESLIPTQVSAGLYSVITSVGLVANTRYKLVRTWTVGVHTITKTRFFETEIGGVMVVPPADQRLLDLQKERPLSSYDVTKSSDSISGRVNR